MTHFGVGFFRCERPFDAYASGFALSLPCADLDFDHVKSAGVLGGVADRKIRRASEDLEAW